MVNTFDDSMLAIIEKIDLQQTPDDTLVRRVNEMWFGWLRTLVSGIFGSYHPIQPTSESVVQMILAAIEKRYLDERLQGETYKEGSSGFTNRERGLFIHMFAAVVCLMELRTRYPFSEMDEVFTRMLDSDHVHIRTASGLALLAMGNEDVKLDLDGLEKSIVLGAFFSFPLNYYFQILHNLLKREDLYKPIAKEIRVHLEKESLYFSTGSYVKYRSLETAIFLALTNELSKHCLMYLVWLSESNAQDVIELAYVKRIRKVLTALIEANPETRQIIADYMITEGREAITSEFIAFYKAWEMVAWRNVDEQVVKDYLELAGKVDDSWGYDSARVIIKAILPWPNRVPLVVEWFRNYTDSFLRSDSNNNLDWESDSDEDLDWEPDLDDDSDEDDSDSEFLSRLIGGLGELVRQAEVTSSLLSLAKNASSIHVRYAALSSLMHYGLEPQRVNSILNEEKPKTTKYLQSLKNSSSSLILAAGLKERLVTDEEVIRFMDEELQYELEKFEHFSL